LFQTFFLIFHSQHEGMSIAAKSVLMVLDTFFTFANEEMQMTSVVLTEGFLAQLFGGG
jgi:hypothetical protein